MGVGAGSNATGPYLPRFVAPGTPGLNAAGRRHVSSVPSRLTTARHCVRSVSADLGVADWQGTSAPNGSVTRSSASGRTGRRSAFPSRATGMRGRCTFRGTATTSTTSSTTATPRRSASWRSTISGKRTSWQPEQLIALYKRAGAKYFFALANHHDNFDAYDSKYQAWNSVNVGPEEGHREADGPRPCAGRGAPLRCQQPLRPRLALAADRLRLRPGRDRWPASATMRITLTKADGKGKWWDGLDPAGAIHGPQHRDAGRGRDDRRGESIPQAARPVVRDGAAQQPGVRGPLVSALPGSGRQVRPRRSLFRRRRTAAGSGRAGHRRALSTTRRSSAASGKLDVVLNCKGLGPVVARRHGRGHRARRFGRASAQFPWQTDTCIGSWHYERRLFEQHRYKTAKQVVQMLIDIVSKNGNLMLSVPIRGNGTIDADEVACLEGIAGWMTAERRGNLRHAPVGRLRRRVRSTVKTAPRGQFGGARDVRGYTAEDVSGSRAKATRCTPSFWDGLKTAYSDDQVARARRRKLAAKNVARVDLLGLVVIACFASRRTPRGLAVTLPDRKAQRSMPTACGSFFSRRASERDVGPNGSFVSGGSEQRSPCRLRSTAARRGCRCRRPPDSVDAEAAARAAHQRPQSLRCASRLAVPVFDSGDG